MNSSNKLHNEIRLIPKPVKLSFSSNIGKEFLLNSKTSIYTSPGLQSVGMYLKHFLLPATGYDISLKDQIDSIDGFSKNAIILKLDKGKKDLGNEGYTLLVTSENVEITAMEKEGIFYGIQSFRQLLPAEIEKKSVIEDNLWSIPPVKIIDYPRFPWRGFMLDEGRHFLGMDFVKRILDLMALHKLNVFHWHLTEDQGWRIEIKKYPKLVTLGSSRKETQVGGFFSFITKKRDKIPHNGYYTQEQLKEIINYASVRCITVVPEIDIPGHSMAALAAYPEFSCTGGPFEVQTGFGIKKEVFCAGKESTFTFLQDVMRELITVFPSGFIHIGGDEAPKNRWKNCSDCQKRIKTENLSDEHGLQTYFINRISKYLLSNNKIPIGWNDVLSPGLHEDVLSQYWFGGRKKVLEHARHGRNFIISKFFNTYLDYNYYLTPLRKCYRFEPVPKNLEPEFHKNIMGVEAPLWTEWVTNPQKADWQIFPRLTALAEVGWTLKENKNYTSFKRRLKSFNKRLDLLNVNYAQKEENDPGFVKRIFSPLFMLKSP
ncbi:MAG: beta-N-acetylhexosaminidase [Candidatus Hodarchaeales archaeon]